jgi:hypothetical protein
MTTLPVDILLTHTPAMRRLYYGELSTSCVALAELYFLRQINPSTRQF